MKKKILAGSLAALILTAAVLFTGCGTVVSSHTSSAAAPAATAQTGSAVTPAGVTAPAATPSAVSAETEDLFTDRDLSQTPDLSEAAAVTVIGMYETTAVDNEPRRVEFHANRPFLYVISEQSTGAVFFIGTYTGK